MKYKNSKLKTISSLLAPSVPGLLLYMFLAALGMVLNQFEIIKKYLQLPHDLEFGRTVAGWADHLLTSLIGEKTTETLVVGFFWAIVGLGVYMFLRGLARLAVELDDDLGVRGYVWPKGTDRYQPLRILMEQVAFRTMAVIGLILLLFGPVAAILRGPVLVDFWGDNNALQLAGWFVVSVLTWHAVVVLLRLALLRARLLG